MGAGTWTRCAAWVALTVAAGCATRPSGVGPESPYWGPIGSDDVERGRGRFTIVCAPCHIHHDMREAPPLARIAWRAPEIRHQIREGSALMPSIPRSRLRDADIEPLLAYLATIGAAVDDAVPASARRRTDDDEDAMRAERARVRAHEDRPRSEASAATGLPDGGAIPEPERGGAGPPSDAGLPPTDAADAGVPAPPIDGGIPGPPPPDAAAPPAAEPPSPRDPQEGAADLGSPVER